MAETQIEKRAGRERARIVRLIRASGVEEDVIALARPVIENTAWMAVKLDDARQTIAESHVAISYDNGGGQRGIRENPLFRGYEALWKSYIAGVRQIIELMPERASETAQVENTKSATVLSMIQARRKAQG